MRTMHNLRTTAALTIAAVLIGVLTPPAPAQQTQLGSDTKTITIKDENGTGVALRVPESLANDQCERRLYGTPGGVLGMFDTLYDAERRTDSYEAALRDICMQAEDRVSQYLPVLQSLEAVGMTADEIDTILEVVDKGADAINKKYVQGGTLSADLKNKLALAGRKLNAAKKNPAFAAACIAIADIQATGEVLRAFLHSAVASDAAYSRLETIKTAIADGKANGVSVDPALDKAVEQAEVNLLAAQSQIGAFAVYVNDNLDSITGSALDLGSTLAVEAAKFSAPVAMWVGAPLATYNTLKDVSDQWEMAQNAVSMATIAATLSDSAKHAGVSSYDLSVLVATADVAFYDQMHDTLSTGGAKFKDLMTPGHVNQDWAEYYTSRSDAVAESQEAALVARYEQTTTESATTILKNYKSVPGGVTLEGTAVVPSVKALRYYRSLNAFVFDGKVAYVSPVPAQDIKTILRSIADDDRLGVSLAGDFISYGALDRDTAIAKTIAIADELLGHIAFGGQHGDMFAEYRLANGYVPKKNSETLSHSMCVYFRFGDYEFHMRGPRWEKKSSHLAITLVPTDKEKRAEDGGAVPDFAAIEKRSIPSAWRENVEHISEHSSYYMKERILRVVDAYGEAAAFARGLKRSGVDLNALSDGIPSRSLGSVSEVETTSRASEPSSVRQEVASAIEQRKQPGAHQVQTAVLQTRAQEPDGLQESVRRREEGRQTRHGGSGTLLLGQGTLNGQNLDQNNWTVSVQRGQDIGGSIRCNAKNTMGSGAVVQFGYTWTWGNREKAYRSLPSRIPNGRTSTQDVSISLTAPMTPGVYYVFIVFSGEYNLDQVFSMSNWSARRIKWNDGNDIVDLREADILFAHKNGYVDAWPFMYSDKYGMYDIAVLPIRVIVE